MTNPKLQEWNKKLTDAEWYLFVCKKKKRKRKKNLKQEWLLAFSVIFTSHNIHYIMPITRHCHVNILPTSTEHKKRQKDKLFHFSYHFSLFLTISLLFKCRFVAWRRASPWKFASYCLCHNKLAFFWYIYIYGVCVFFCVFFAAVPFYYFFFLFFVLFFLFFFFFFFLFFLLKK